MDCDAFYAAVEKRDNPSLADRPVIVGTMKGLRQMTLQLHQQDICVNSVPYPAVPHGSERLRISLTANHTQGQLTRALECIQEAGRLAELVD